MVGFDGPCGTCFACAPVVRSHDLQNFPGKGGAGMLKIHSRLPVFGGAQMGTVLGHSWLPYTSDSTSVVVIVTVTITVTT
jgi:hypothetical protein